jgi:hypothetical protein
MTERSDGGTPAAALCAFSSSGFRVLCTQRLLVKLVLTLQRLNKGVTAALKLCFQLVHTIALATDPRLDPVPVQAIAACMRILDSEQLEVLLPVRTNRMVEVSRLKGVDRSLPLG